MFRKADSDSDPSDVELGISVETLKGQTAKPRAEALGICICMDKALHGRRMMHRRFRARSRIIASPGAHALGFAAHAPLGRNSLAQQN
jgi:hypothetical protein